MCGKNYAVLDRRPTLRIQQSPSRSLTASSSAAIDIVPSSSAAIDIVPFSSDAIVVGPATPCVPSSPRAPFVCIFPENTEVFAIFHSIRSSGRAPVPPPAALVFAIPSSASGAP